MRGTCRIGIGYDSHAFEAGRPLILGGVRVDAERGLAGHSDADVLLHAIMDALLGAAALGDIGTHFPPEDDRYRDAVSTRLAGSVAGLVTDAGYRIVNVDASLVLERPRIGPYVARMRAEIAGALGVDVEAVGVKATTNEGMGFVGRGEGAAAMAVAMVEPIGTPGE